MTEYTKSVYYNYFVSVVKFFQIIVKTPCPTLSHANFDEICYESASYNTSTVFLFTISPTYIYSWYSYHIVPYVFVFIE